MNKICHFDAMNNTSAHLRTLTLVIMVMLMTSATFSQSLPKDMQVTTNSYGFGQYSERNAITFTYQSQIAGDQVSQLCEEMVDRWAHCIETANQSGKTQAIIVAKVNQSTSPPEWLNSHTIAFHKTEKGQWERMQLCNIVAEKREKREESKEKDAEHVPPDGRGEAPRH